MLELLKARQGQNVSSSLPLSDAASGPLAHHSVAMDSGKLVPLSLPTAIWNRLTVNGFPTP